MSRYSRIFLRPKDSWTIESSSKISTSVEPGSSSSPGFSYPPSSLPSHDPDSPYAMSSPAPHPYTLGAAIRSPIETSSREGTNTTNHDQAPTNTSDYHNITEKPPESPGMGVQYPRNEIPISSNDSRSPPRPLHLRPAILLFIFLPVPPLLSLIYMIIGHAILRASKSSPDSIFQSPLLSSIEAGATGGVILSLPIALLLYILVIPSRPTTAPEDFFDDDNSSTLRQARYIRRLGYVVSALLVLCIGGLAGPLGVTCLSNGTLDSFVGNKKLLSTGAAAAAGFLGGVIITFGALTLCIIGMATWTISMRRKHQRAS
ncbi:hypothetical protein JR316_0003315 [Psilocybe cubensis]|uniref:Uncharacterized protein n=2 Tax=Psilocybe cubensis TaxID=181762 RepID=A0ACB8H869_PSICU|nr:hypothetical protein JR316_0003315 [Psilocybe cubensis]KAH9483837.1 hypothetical protein JR316_0003315 [Psilocybe cubensis]